MKKQTTLEQAALNILLNRSESTEINEGIKSIKIDWNKLNDDNILDLFEYAAEVFLEKFIEPSFDDDSEVASKYAAFTKSLDRFTSTYKQAKKSLD